MIENNLNYGASYSTQANENGTQDDTQGDTQDDTQENVGLVTCNGVYNSFDIAA